MHEMKSGLSAFIMRIVEQKRSLGYKYKSQEYQLWRFDRFCLLNYPSETELTLEVVMHWSERHGSESISAQEGRISPVRQLAKYMLSIGKPAFMIPQLIPGKGLKYMPHIFTDFELSCFFRETDNFLYDKRFPERHLVISVIFRLIYCCGLRNSEARSLRMVDIDFHNGILCIINSKSRSRYVPLSDDLLWLCKKYNVLAEKIYPSRKWFFQNRYGRCYSADTVDYMFHQCWNRTGIIVAEGNQPRVHDFRHFFARKRLDLWVKEDMDLKTFQPYLSMYMGHKTFAETDYYLSLTEAFYPEFRKRSSLSESLFPEVEE